MRIAWYDHGQIAASLAVPDLPFPEETWGIYGEKAHQHFHLDVVGMSMWRIPLLHRLLDDGHELVWLTRRKVDPSPELDADMARLVEQRPEFARYVRLPDPCLNEDQFLIHPYRTFLNGHYFADQRDIFAASDAPSTDMLRYWVAENVLGVLPEADVFVCAVMRADEATAFEVSYATGVYLRRGTPVVLWDQDRQLSGVKAAFERLGDPWPHPLVTIVAPYEEETIYGRPLTIDYPYVRGYERDPLPVSEKHGAVYVGNDYGRRDAMERLLLHLPENGIPVTVYGRYEAKDGPRWCARFPRVEWAGRVPPNRVPSAVARGLFTVNVVKREYEPIGLLTLRTFDANCYGTLQVGDRRIKRLSRYVPSDYLVDSKTESVAVAKRIVGYGDATYVEELERQRSLTRVNDMDAFVARFYEYLEIATSKAPPRSFDRIPLHEIPPPQQKQPGRLCLGDDGWLPVGTPFHGGVEGWSPSWKADKERKKAESLTVYEET